MALLTLLGQAQAALPQGPQGPVDRPRTLPSRSESWPERLPSLKGLPSSDEGTYLSPKLQHGGESKRVQFFYHGHAFDARSDAGIPARKWMLERRLRSYTGHWLEDPHTVDEEMDELGLRPVCVPYVARFLEHPSMGPLVVERAEQQGVTIPQARIDMAIDICSEAFRRRRRQRQRHAAWMVNLAYTDPREWLLQWGFHLDAKRDEIQDFIDGRGLRQAHADLELVNFECSHLQSTDSVDARSACSASST
ncbi:unnamed protein product, partial [Prorocentrum cordatum]